MLLKAELFLSLTMQFRFYFWLTVCLNLTFLLPLNGRCFANSFLDFRPFFLLPKMVFTNFTNHPDASDRASIGRPKCPDRCSCVDSASANESFAEPDHFETNCTEIDSGLASVLDEVPRGTSHLYLYKSVFSAKNRLRLPVLDRLRFLKLTLNSFEFIDDDAFSTIPQLHTL